MAINVINCNKYILWGDLFLLDDTIAVWKTWLTKEFFLLGTCTMANINKKCLYHIKRSLQQISLSVFE